MHVVIIRQWTLLALRGAAAILLGLLSATDAFGSLTALVVLAGAYALADAACGLWAARARLRAGEPWRWQAGDAVPSLLFVLTTVFALRWPAAVFSLLLTAWAVGRGGVPLAGAIAQGQLRSDPLRTADALWALGFGSWMWLDPGPGALAAVTYLGTYLLGAGVLQLCRAFALRSKADWRQPTGVLRWRGLPAFAHALRTRRLTRQRAK
jgi:uncharacterized membrane protein HdeD (DUF308 family)